MSGISVEIICHAAPEYENAKQLLRRATARKDANQLEAAIEDLRAAYELIRKTRVDCTAEVFLRLPMYLQLAGRANEAWQEFDQILLAGYPNMQPSEMAWHSMESEVYDKMRLFLEREGRLKLAISMRAASVIAQIRAEYSRPKNSDWAKARIASLSSQEYLRQWVGPLVKRAKLHGDLDGAVAVLAEWANALPDVDDGKYAEAFSRALGCRHPQGI